jgi:hypothetical protein
VDVASLDGAGGMMISPSKYLSIFSTSATPAAVRDHYYTGTIKKNCHILSAYFV